MILTVTHTQASLPISSGTRARTVWQRVVQSWAVLEADIVQARINNAC